MVWLEIPGKVSEFHIIDDLKSTIITSVNELKTSACKYESIIETEMIELYKEAYNLEKEFEYKLIGLYENLKSTNASEQFRPLVKRIESIIEKIDSNDYD